VMKVAGQLTTVVVDPKPMPDPGTSEGLRHEPAFPHHILHRVRVRIDDRFTQVAAVLLKDEVRAVLHANGILPYLDAEASGVKDRGQTVLRRPTGESSGNVRAHVTTHH